MFWISLAFLFLLGCGRSVEPPVEAAPRVAPADTCQPPECFPDVPPPPLEGTLATLAEMQFEGREIPEAEFHALARRAFRAELDAQDQAVRDSKAGGWFHRSEVTEQEMFARWLEGMGVKPFPFRLPGQGPR